MRLQALILIAVCLLIFSAGLNAQGMCNARNIAGTYVTRIDGWATIGVANGFPMFAPVKGIGTATVDATGKFTGTMTNVFAGGAPYTVATTGSFNVTSDCKISAQASCTTGCAWTAVGVFTNNTKEAHLVITSQTKNGRPEPLTASLDMKYVGN